MPSPRYWYQGRAERWSLRSLIIYRLPPLKPPRRKLRGRFRGSAQNWRGGLRTEKAHKVGSRRLQDPRSPPSTLPHGRAAKESGFALHRAPFQPAGSRLPKVAHCQQAEARTQPPPTRGPLEIGRSAGFYRLTLRASAGWGQGSRSASVGRAGRYAPRPLVRRSRLRVSREHPPLRFG